jgi:DNA ligase-1
MAPASKRQKLNNGSKASPAKPKGLEYFFNKQNGNATPKLTDAPQQPVQSEELDGDLTDEQLARKLQAEWDAEHAEHLENSRKASTPSGLSDEAGQQSKADDGAKGAALAQSTARDDEPTPDLGEGIKPKAPVAKNAFGGLMGKNTLSLQSSGAEEDTVSYSIPFDESPLTFDPQKYLPDLKKQWAEQGGSATYAIITRCFILVNSTTSRIKIVDTLVNFLRTLIEGDPESLLPAVWLATNSISPSYISLELGLGGSAISKALKNVCGLDSKSLKALYDKVGDAGDVAYEAKKKQSFTLRKPKPLTIKGVYDSLVKIARIEGQGSGDRKQSIVDKLLQDARGAEENRYVVRTLCQHLRIGAVKTTMLIALSRAFLLSKPPGAEFATKSQEELRKLKKEQLAELYKESEETVKACFARRPNYNDLVPTLLEIGVCDELLVRCGLTLHIPLMPMLGSITRDLSEMLTKLQGRDFTCEWKYDGQRAQVHCDDKGKVSIFSRHLELMTDKYPDLVALIPQIRGEGVSSFIMEGEVVAVDKESGELRTFQTLTNRARKDVAISEIKVNVCLFAFDLMYLNGQPLLDRTFRERRELLRSLFVEVPRHFTWVKSLDATSQDSETVLDFFKSATENKCEGIMVKILDNLPDPTLPAPNPDEGAIPAPEADGNVTIVTPRKGKLKKGAQNGDKEKVVTRRKALLSTYEPDKRLDSWLKVKKDYATSADTLDLIPIAGWHGQGRKAAWWSPILLACRNPETGSLEAVCKCISGFTDAFYKANKDFYAEDGPNSLPQKPGYVEYTGGYPDCWFEPQEVWEIAFADITVSPVYTSAIGLVDPDKGLSLRFPRFLRKREDKSIEEASTSDFLAGLWEKQMARAPVVGGEQASAAVDDGYEDL